MLTRNSWDNVNVKRMDRTGARLLTAITEYGISSPVISLSNLCEYPVSNSWRAGRLPSGLDPETHGCTKTCDRNLGIMVPGVQGILNGNDVRKPQSAKLVRPPRESVLLPLPAIHIMADKVHNPKVTMATLQSLYD
jgi:hypothetical protein